MDEFDATQTLSTKTLIQLTSALSLVAIVTIPVTVAFDAGAAIATAAASAEAEHSAISPAVIKSNSAILITAASNQHPICLVT